MVEWSGTALQKLAHRFDSGQRLTDEPMNRRAMSTEQRVQEGGNYSMAKVEVLYTDEATVRLVAAQVVVLTAVALISGAAWVALVLVVDFGTRATGLLPSPFALLADRMVVVANLSRDPVFLPPKRFAAAIGLLFSVGILALLLLDLDVAAYTVGGVLLLCASLEAVLNYCVGCQVFHLGNTLLQKLN